jgi:hypothetical protein
MEYYTELLLLWREHVVNICENMGCGVITKYLRRIAFNKNKFIIDIITFKPKINILNTNESRSFILKMS